MSRSPIAVVLVAAAGLLVASPARGDVRKLKLGELLELARRKAPQIKIAEAQLETAAATRREIGSNYAPTGELTYFITGAPAIQCAVPASDQPALDALVKSGDTAKAATFRQQNCINSVDPGNGQSVNVLNFNIAGVGMQFEARILQPLYTFGKLEYAMRAASHGIEAGRRNVDAARMEVELLATRGYWGLKMARTSRDVITSAVDELKPFEKKIADDLDSDKPKYTIDDLQRMRVALAQLDMYIASLDRGVEVARRGLHALVGEEVDIDDEELGPVEIIEHPMDYYVTAAAASRPELLQIDEGVAALHDVARARRSEMFPDLGLVADVLVRYAPTVEDSQSAFMNHANQTGFSLLLALRQPLDIAQKILRWRHALADADVISAQRDGLRRAIAFEINNAYLALDEARHRLKIAEKGQKVAQGWLSAVRQNVDLGTAEPRVLVEAARAYFELRIAYLSAISDVNVDTAILRRASGIDVAR